MTSASTLDERSRELRRIVVRMLRASRRGHVGSAFSCIEILRVLYDDVLRFDAINPKWPNRDRCILSKGHGCLALYAILADKGFFPQAELDRFCAARRHPRRASGREQGARRRGQHRRTRSRPQYRPGNGSSPADGEIRLACLRDSRRWRMQRRLGLGSRDVRGQTQARQPHGHCRLQQESSLRLDARSAGPGAIRG